MNHHFGHKASLNETTFTKQILLIDLALNQTLASIVIPLIGELFSMHR